MLMPRISMSGVLAATVMAVPSWTSRASAAAVPGIETDREDEDDAGDHVLARRVDTVEGESVLERLHDERAQHGARDRPNAAGERGPADHGGSNHVELVAHADVEGRSIEASRRDGCRDRAEDAHQDVDLEDRPARVDAGQLGRLWIAAVGIDVTAEAAPRRDEAHDERHGDQQHHRIREARRDVEALRRHRDVVLLGVLRDETLRPEVLVSEPRQAEDGDTAEHGEQDLGPDRTQRESEASPLSAAVREEPNDRDAADDR